MFYIVESEKQLQRLRDISTYLDECYVEVITTNDNFHPALTSPVAVYVRPLEKEVDPETGKEVGWKSGYIIPIDHNEGLCVELETVQEILALYKTVYVLDHKATLYHLMHKNFVDLSIRHVMDCYEKLEYFIREKTYNWFYNRYGGRKDVNKIIPLAKIYERAEATFDQIQESLSDPEPPGFDFYNRVATNIFWLIEREGIRVDVHEFIEKFHPTNPDFSIEGETVYTRYNLCNITGRPTNSFNSVNFLAIPKGKEFRRCFKPKNDEFVQMDFDGYHVRLVANQTGYKIPTNIKAHKYLASQYFHKDVDKLTKEEYAEAKQVNFQSIYGTIPWEYEKLDFFRLLKGWVDHIWEEYTTGCECVFDPISDKPFRDLPEMKPTKLINYLVQSIETSRNVVRLFKVLRYLQNYRTKVILVTYDSILLDWDERDGEEVLTKVQQLLEVGDFPVSVEKSRDLNFS